METISGKFSSQMHEKLVADISPSVLSLRTPLNNEPENINSII
jgi:hypothetical protein